MTMFCRGSATYGSDRFVKGLIVCRIDCLCFETERAFFETCLFRSLLHLQHSFRSSGG